MAKKAPVKASEPTPEPAVAETPRTDGDGEKTHVIYVGDVAYLHEHPRAFQIFVGGTTYHHKREHADGAWIYE